MRVWLDDVRPLPEGFDVHARTAAEAIALLERGGVMLVSLDHDLGDEANGSGYDVARWIEERAFRWAQGQQGGLAPLECAVHSQNPVGARNMLQALRNARRFWEAGRG